MFVDLSNITAKFFGDLFSYMIIGFLAIIKPILETILPSLFVYGTVATFLTKETKPFNIGIKVLFLYLVVVVFYRGLLQ